MSVSQDVCTAPKEGCLIRRLSHDVGHHLIRRRKIDLNRVLQVQLTGKMYTAARLGAHVSVVCTYGRVVRESGRVASGAHGTPF